MTVVKVATLRPGRGAAIPGGTDPRFTRDSRGRIYLFDDLVPGRILVFDSLGTFVRGLGGAGQKPGEFQIIKHIVAGPGDSLHVFDDATELHTVLDPSGKFARSRRYPGSNRGLVLLPDDRVITSRSISTPERAGLPLHISDDTGAIQQSFGSPAGFWRADLPQTLMRSLCSARKDGLWVAYFSQYLIESWSIDGKLRESLGRTVPWFKPWIKPEGRIGTAAPQPRLTSIACEPSGRLWTTVLVPDSQWTEGLGERVGEKGKAVTVADPNRYYDTVVEVIDPATRRVIGSRRFDVALYELFAPGYAWAVRPNTRGQRQFEIWRVRLLQK